MKTFEDYCSDNQYAGSIKEDTTYLCLHFTKDHEGNKINTPYPGKTNTPYSSYGNKIFWKISNVIILVYVLLYATYHSTGSSDTDQIVSLVGPAGDPRDQRVRSQLIGKDLVSGLLVYELPLSSLRKKYRLNLKNDMPPRDKLEEEKPRRRGKVYNWETARYGKIWYDDDIHDLRSVKTEFPAIVFNDELSSERTLSCEPTVSSLNNNEIDFRLSFDESDDEDYTPTVSYFDDLDFLKDFENEFPAIVYNDALTSKSNSSTEPVEIPHCIDEFDLKTKTSLSECDEEEQNIIYFNHLFSFNIIYLDDSKSDKDNDDHEIDIKQSSGGNVINTDDGAYAQNKLLETSFSIRGIPVYGYGVLVSDLAAKKSTKLVKYQSSGILCVIVVMLEYRRIHNTHSCS
ncbi:hypothetical protein Tco_1448640 [Tanacetum coccineum]